MDVDAIRDRLAIRDLVEAYVEAVDRRDDDAFGALFTPDAILIVCKKDQATREFTGERLRAIPSNVRFRKTFHFVGNHRCHIDGDVATGVTYCQAHHIVDDEDGDSTDHVMTIRYTDTYRRGPDGTSWLFSRRENQQEWSTDLPTQATMP